MKMVDWVLYIVFLLAPQSAQDVGTFVNRQDCLIALADARTALRLPDSATSATRFACIPSVGKGKP
jgi:hypothetical protein